MRMRNLMVLGSAVLLIAASAIAQPEPGKDKDHDKDHGHGKPPASAAASAAASAGASETPGASASAPGHDRDTENPAGKDKATGRGNSPFAAIDESEAQRSRRLAHRKEQHDKVVAALKGKANALSKEQRDLIAHHNRVVARLEWVRAWAENEKKTELVTRTEAALAKEDARFNTKLTDLASKAGGK